MPNKGTRRRTESSAVTSDTSSSSSSSILRPGSVRINVQGAFIVDDEADSPNGASADQHGTKDIRLPNHTATVSHIAVDVSLAYLCWSAAHCYFGSHTRLVVFWEALNAQTWRRRFLFFRSVARSPSLSTSRRNPSRASPGDG